MNVFDRKQLAAKEKPMSTIDSENNGKPTPEAAQTKVGRKPAKKTKPAKKAARAKNTAIKPKADRSNKKAEVIGMMKGPKGATLAEIIKSHRLAGAHRARLRQHPGQQGRRKDPVH
jgi:hypothetical protein